MADGQHKAYIGNLAYDTIASDIEALLKHLQLDDATIKQCDVHLVHDRESGRFKGFSYVTFPDEELLNMAIESLNGTDYGGRALKVNRATPRDRNQGGRGGGRGGRGGNGGGRGGFRRDGNDGGYRRDGNDGGHRGGGHRGGHRGQRKSQSEDHDSDRKVSESEGRSEPPAERPRLNLKPRCTDPAALAAKKAQEEAETAARQAKLFG